MIPKYTYNLLIDMENQNLLIQIGESDTANSFAVGDIVNERWENAIKNGWDKKPDENGNVVTRLFICQAVSSFYRNKQPRTVRYYADVAAIYPQKIRDKYEMLSFAHFAKARKYPDWEVYLEWGADGPRTVEACEAEWAKRGSSAVPPVDVPELPPASENSFSFVSVCRRMVSSLANFAKREDVPELARAKVAQASQLLDEAREIAHQEEIAQKEKVC